MFNVYTLRISKLTQTLLLLTRMANDQFPDKKAISITGLIGEKIKMFEDHILGKSLKLIKEIDPECILETNFFLAESLIINLIGNAVKHNVNNGVINIICISGINNIISGDSSLTLGMTGHLGGQMWVVVAARNGESPQLPT